MCNIVRNLIIAGVSATVLTMAAVPASAKICKSTTISGVSTGYLPSAKAGARAQWIKNVQTVYGPVWSLYGLAANKSFNCLAPHDPTLKTVRCTVRARPCLAEFKTPIKFRK